MGGSERRAVLRSRVLLNDVCQFVGEQVSPSLIAWCECTAPEDDSLSCGVGPRPYCASRVQRLFVGVHTDLAEVEAEAGLEEGARRRVEGLPGCADHIVHNGGHFASSRFGRSGAFELKRLRFRVLVA